ncbi:sugar phosphate nucleotidyltransferase [Allorhizocola rhizosphaerae]|uniref:sugar phosphate nucleotidyltransferase n=1 Tax=Allorhizocola rhizosphaerae TaxID=1872709 RepID=UPI000E3BF563|nr:sugar phosphate nucleotidyltransferase [Allorhizocola rhizosphaerae]
MTPDICALVLAAGLGTRLRPLTTLVPKALVPVGNVPLLDRALDRLAALGFTGSGRVAVNAHHHLEQMLRHVDGRAHVSIEDDPLGTAGAVGKLRDWIGGRGVLVLNADAYCTDPMDGLLAGWDGKTVRMAGHVGDDGHPSFHGLAFAGASLLPAEEAERLDAVLSHLVLTTWRPAEREGRLEVVPIDGVYIDTGTPADYLQANMHAASGRNLIADGAMITGSASQSVLGAGAAVHGRVTRSVLWPGARVARDEVLTDSVRVGSDMTVTRT